MTNQPNSNKGNMALPIAMMFALFFMISFVTGIQNPLGVIVKEQFTLSNMASQFGNAANFIAYAFMGLPAGMLLSRIGYKKTALTAVVVGFVGVGITFLAGQANNFPVYLIGAFVSGLSMCMLNTVVNPMLNNLGGGGKKSNQLIQFGGAINSIGATIAPVLGGMLIGNAASATLKDANPIFFLAMGIFALVFIVLSMVQIPEIGLSKEKSSMSSDIKSLFTFRHYVMGIIAIFLYVGIEVGIANVLSLYLTKGDIAGILPIDASVAGSVVGMYWLLMLVGRFIGGSIGGRFSSRTMLMTVATVGIAFVLVGMYLPTDITINMPGFQNLSFISQSVPVGVLFFVLCGLCTSVMWGCIFNLAVKGLGKYTASGSGLFMVMVCGGGILPLIQAKVADATSYLTSYWVIVLALAFILFFATVVCRKFKED